jgi:single-strand DNA-binding protein
MADLNRVTISGNLTRDPELRTVGSNGTSVCEMRVAVNSREKQGSEWVDKPNYFDVTVWGNQGVRCSEYLEKGRPVAVEGVLRWREWKAQDGSNRQAVSITADNVKFLGSPREAGSQNTGGSPAAYGGEPAPDSQPAAAVAAGPQNNGQEVTGGDDDLPF